MYKDFIKIGLEIVVGRDSLAIQTVQMGFLEKKKKIIIFENKS